MTMQVAMVGSDGGIIIASDRKVWRGSSPSIDQIGNETDAPVIESKIEFCSQKNIAIACAEDLNAARKVASQIISEMKDKDCADEYSAAAAMQAIAENVLNNDGSKIRCLIALRCPDWRLFTCTFGFDDLGNYGGICEPRFGGWEIAGHVTNPAIFLVRRYYDENDSSESLIPLAAYLVLCARDYNSERIEDLDVIQCDTKGVRRLSGASISELKKAVTEWDSVIRDVFLGYHKDYSYVPSHAL